MRVPTPFLAFLAAALLPAAASAQDGSHLTIEARAVPASVAPGDTVTVEIAIDVEAGWHVYGSLDTGVPTKLVWKDTAGLQPDGKAQIPPGVPREHGGITNFWIEGSAVLRQRFTVPKDAKAGTLVLKGQVTYMACTPEFCDPPGKDAFEAKVVVTGSGAGGANAAGTATEPAPPSPQPATGAGAGTGSGLGLDPFAEPPKLQLAPKLVPAVARPGEKVTLVLGVKVDEGWHVYGSADTNSPSKLVLHDVGPLEVRGDAAVPPGEEHDLGIVSHWLKGSFAVEQTFVVPANVAPGAIELRGALDYLPCDESSCLEPTKTPFAATLQVEAGAPRAEFDAATAPPRVAGPTPKPPANGGKPVPPVPPVNGAEPPADAGAKPELRQPKFTIDDVGDENALTGSLWALILLSIGGGLFALVMPCTYPMIPITFSFFTKQAEARHGKVLSLALVYGVGIVLMFVLVGVLASGTIFRFAGHWATNLVIGVAFVVFALSLFGFFTLQLPAFVTNAAGRASRAGGVLGVFLMGATLVVTSFTCTAPIVGALLAGVAEGGYGRVALGMAVFGLTMAAPFVLLALLPGRVKALPKSGEWMNTLKVSLGFVELAAALKFVSNVDLALGWGILPRETFLMAWAFVFVVLALFLFGLFAHRGVPVHGTSATRNGFGLASLAFAFYCLFGTMGFQLDPVMTAFEPPYRLRAVEEHTIVKDDHEAALALAQRDHKYVLVNFTGFT